MRAGLLQDEGERMVQGDSLPLNRKLPATVSHGVNEFA